MPEVKKVSENSSIEELEASLAVSGLNFDIAQSIDHVIESWSLVYQCYRRADLIQANPEEIHTVRQAVDERTLVVLGRIRETAVSTMSVYIDGPQGLPLDTVYHDELNQLRDQGRTLVELGLFADRREHLFRSIDAILELMRHCCHYAVNSEAVDAVVGVNPRHVAFYTRLLGFDVIAEEKSYETVNGFPVMLLHLDWPLKTSAAKLPRGLAHLASPAIGPAFYADRVKMTPELIRDTPIQRYLDRDLAAVSSM